MIESVLIANDSTALLAQDQSLPLASFRVSFRRGSIHDPVGQEGFCYHMSELACRGTKRRSREAFDRAIDQLGASIGSSASLDSFTISGTCLKRNFQSLFELLCEVLAEPGFSEEEHEQLVRETTRELEELRDDDASVAARFFQRECTDRSPYMRTTLGTAASLASLDLAGLATGFANATAADNLVLGFAGDITVKEATNLGDLLCSATQIGVGTAPAEFEAPNSHSVGRRLLRIHKPQRSQNTLQLGHLVPAYEHPDFPALFLAETAFGGMFSSTLMQELRVKRGWTYGAYSRMSKTRHPHRLSVSASCANEVAADAIALTAKLFEELANQGPRVAELALARNFLRDTNLFQAETARQKLRQAMGSTILDLPLDRPVHFIQQLVELGDDEVKAACQRHLKPDDLFTTVVCSPEQLKDETQASLLAPMGEEGIVKFDSY